MRIGIQAWGTDGDIEPLLAIAVELSKRNHTVNLDILRVKYRDYSFLSVYENLNVSVIPFPEKRMEEENHGISKNIWDTSNPNAGSFIWKRFSLIEYDLFSSAEKLCLTSDVVLGTQHTLFLCCLAEKYGIIYFSLSYEHSLVRSKYFPPIGYECDEEEWIIFMWDKLDKHIYDTCHEGVDSFRAAIGLPPVTSVVDGIYQSKLLNIISYSSNLYPRNPDDWAGRHYTCGYINSENIYSDWSIPKELNDFIESGNSPIFICFSNSILFEDDLSSLQNLIISAVISSGERAIFLSNWEENSSINEKVFKLSGFSYLPKLFEKCSLLIHSGGLGFTHDAARSGLPSIVVPYGMDHFYNADVLKWHGLTSHIIPRVEITEERLSGAILDSMKNTGLKNIAAEFSKKEIKDRGVYMAADLIEENFNQLIKKSNDENQKQIKIHERHVN